MITGHKDFFILRAAQRGYAIADVMPCVVAQDGDAWTVDEEHPAYPRVKPKPPTLQAVPAAGDKKNVPHRLISYEEFKQRLALQQIYFESGHTAATEGAAKRVAKVTTTSGGVGTELKKLLAKIGIKASPTCSCNKRAQIMDEKGIEWCKENINMIVGWLREEATKRKLPFVDLAGKLLVQRAISLAEKAEKKRLAAQQQDQAQDG